MTCDRSVVSSTNKTDHHDVAEILLKVTLNTIDLSLSTIVDKHIFCFIFTDFSLESYTSLAGELLNDLTESFKQKLYEDLGISSYLKDQPCTVTSDTYTPNIDGWKSG